MQSRIFQLQPRQLRALLGSVVFAVLLYGGVVLLQDGSQVFTALTQLSVSAVASLLGLSVLNYLLRFVRWQLFLRQLGGQVTLWQSLRIYLAGFALTTTPGKAGELIRSVYLARHQLPYSRSIGAFICERFSDVLAMLLLTLWGLALYDSARPFVLAVALGFALLLLLFLSPRPLQYLLRKFVFLQRHAVKLVVLQQQIQSCHRQSLLLTATALSVIAWFAEALALFFLCQWVGLDVTIQQCCFIYAFAMLAGAVSFLPGGLGGAEAAMTTLFIAAGSSASLAVTVTIISRLTTLWFAVLIGLVALSSLPMSVSDPDKEQSCD